MSTVESPRTAPADLGPPSERPDADVHELVRAVQQLSLARTIDDVQQIVGTVARRLTGADGATLVLRRGHLCYYADEDAIAPLWKGQQFPIDACISGWAMLNRQAAAIEDIYADERVPHDAYRPTFVKSLAMVPIRTLDPVGAIGNYWATRHQPSERELELLQALADSAAVAMENVRVYEELEQRVLDRTAELEARTRELEETNRSIRSLYAQASQSFQALRARNAHHLEVQHTLAHEVRTPLSAARGILRLTLDAGSGAGTEQARIDLADVDAAVSDVLDVVNRQLEIARLEAGAVPVRVEEVDLGGELAALRAMFRALAQSNAVVLVVEPPDRPLALHTDRALLGHVLRNLVGNALKFTDHGEVRVSARRGGEGAVAIRIADTGIGIAVEDAERIFEEWGQIEQSQAQRPAGSGLGLPLVRRIVEALGGRIQLDSEAGRGSTFTVVLPARVPGERVGR